MKYLCLIYQDEAAVDALPDDDYAAIIDEVHDYREELQRGGHYIASSPLQPMRTATTIRVRDGELTISDGPFAETNEQVGGFYLIDARDLNDAIRLVSRMPPARTGSIEVRPLQEIDHHSWCGRDRRPDV